MMPPPNKKWKVAKIPSLSLARAAHHSPTLRHQWGGFPVQTGYTCKHLFNVIRNVSTWSGLAALRRDQTASAWRDKKPPIRVQPPGLTPSFWHLLVGSVVSRYLRKERRGVPVSERRIQSKEHVWISVISNRMQHAPLQFWTAEQISNMRQKALMHAHFCWMHLETKCCLEYLQIHWLATDTSPSPKLSKWMFISREDTRLGMVNGCFSTVGVHFSWVSP